VSSVRDPAQAWCVHVDDSLSALDLPDLAGSPRIADLGSGAGFPGLALAAALPQSSVALIESVGRKCRFMERVIAEAEIANATVICKRSEDWANGDGREAYDVVTARAVGRLSELAELASPLLRAGGALIAWKGHRDAEEEEELGSAAHDLAMEPETVMAVNPYPSSRNRHLHVIRKSGSTPSGVPRRPGMAKKRPFGSAGPRRDRV